VTGADAAAPCARGVTAVDPLELAAPVLADTPLVLAVAVAGPPDLAAPVVGAPPPVRTLAAARRRSDRDGVPPAAEPARPALEAAVFSWRTTRSARGVVISSVGVAPVDRGDVIAPAF